MHRTQTLVKDFTEGSIPRMLMFFMLPFMASNAFQVLYSTIDMIIVGQFVGSAGLSAVSLGSQILNFVTMLSTGFCTGGQVLLAQLIGADRREELSGVIGTLFSSVLLGGVVISVLIILLRMPLLQLLLSFRGSS